MTALRKRSGGFTIAEVVVASFISTLLVTSAMVLLVGMGKEQRIGLSRSQVNAVATNTIDQIAGIIRGASRAATVTLADLKPGSTTQFYTLRFERPKGTLQEIRFDAANKRVIHDPDRSASGNDMVLRDKASDANSLRPYVSELYFQFPSPSDRNAVTISMLVTDGGKAWSRWRTNAPLQMEFTNNVILRKP